jgi:hypothetical protein
LTELGFGDYVAAVVEVANEYKEQLKVAFTSVLKGNFMRG